MSQAYGKSNIIDPHPMKTKQDMETQAQRLMAFGGSRGWDDMQIMGPGRMLYEEEVTDKGFRAVPFAQDHSPRPVWVDDRIRKLEAMGFSTDRMLIIHEPDPHAKMAQQPQTLVQPLHMSQATANKAKKALIGASTVAVLVAVASAVAAVVVFVLTVVLPILIMGTLLLAGLALGADPLLVYVCDDSTFVLCAAWRETEEAE